MKPTPDLSAGTGTPVACDVLAYGSIQATPEQFASLRQKPGPGPAFAVNFLKHADEQTVAGLAAVLQAIDRFGLDIDGFGDWGIVAAPCFLGRATLVSALQRFNSEGAWGLSPHFIPHRSQHAISGTVSQALKIKGPNFGAGGGPGGFGEAMVSGAVLVEGNGVPGVWVILTGWNPEFVPDSDGRPKSQTVCQALALGLVSPRNEWQGPQLRVVPRPLPRSSRFVPDRHALTAPNLGTILPALNQAGLPTTVVWQMPGGIWIELGRSASRAIIGPPKSLQRRGAQAWVEGDMSGVGTEKQQ